MLKQFIALALAGLLATTCLTLAPAVARTHGGTPTGPVGACTKPVDGNCIAGVAAGGIYYAAGTPGETAFNTLVQQSGQTYLNTVDFNRCGVEYGCGPNKLDSAMTLASTVTAAQFTGCGAYVPTGATPSISCSYTTASPATVTIDSLYLYDTTLTIQNTGGTTQTIISNSTFMAGAALCLNNQSQQLFLNGNTNVFLQNVKFANDPVCNPAGELWGTPAATGLGLQQTASFIGTFVTGTANPGELHVGTGTTGTMYRKSYIDWPQRTPGVYPGTLTQLNELLWFTTWKGIAHTSGTSGTLIIDSTDVDSPNPNPIANGWASWAAGTKAGLFVLSCNTGAGTCAFSSSTNIAAGSHVAIGTQSCTGSACDNGVWQMQLPLTGIGPETMTTGPIAASTGAVSVQNAACVNYKTRFVYAVQIGTIMSSKSNCPIDQQSTYFEMLDGQLGYIGGGGVPHNNDIIEQPGIGVTSTISSFIKKYDVDWYSKWIYKGSVTSLGSFFTNFGSSNYQTTWTTGEISENMLISNATLNNSIDDGTQETTAGGYLSRVVGQGFGSVNATITSYAVSNNGDGTGTLHVAANSGTILAGDYMFTCTNCAVVGAGGPAQITTQITTQGADISTWTVNHYRAFSGSITTGTYPGTILTMTFDKNFLDWSGSPNAGLLMDLNVVNPTLNYSNCTVLTVSGGGIC